jgi:hypothetical protein
VVLPMRHRQRRERKSLAQSSIPTGIQTAPQTTTAMTAMRSSEIRPSDVRPTEPGGIEHGLHQ